MQNKITCSQVQALINFYRDNSLNPKLRDIIDEHLLNCSECRRIYAEFGFSFNNYNSSVDDRFRINLSAYIDNELSSHESVRFKKSAISNPIAKKEMETMYTLKRAIQSYAEKTKNDFKTDYSKLIVNTLKGENPEIKPFNKLIWAFAGMMSAVLIGFLVLSALYF